MAIGTFIFAVISPIFDPYEGDFKLKNFFLYYSKFRLPSTLWNFPKIFMGKIYPASYYSELLIRLKQFAV
jgi:hypothetical protein